MDDRKFPITTHVPSFVEDKDHFLTWQEFSHHYIIEAHALTDWLEREYRNEDFIELGEWEGDPFADPTAERNYFWAGLYGFIARLHWMDHRSYGWNFYVPNIGWMTEEQAADKGYEFFGE